MRRMVIYTLMTLSFEEWLLEKKRPVSVHADVDSWLNSVDSLKKDISILQDIIDKKKKKQKSLDKKPETEPEKETKPKTDDVKSDMPEPKKEPEDKRLDQPARQKDENEPMEDDPKSED